MNDTDSNEGGWDACKQRAELNDVFNQLPTSLKAIMKKINVWTANGTVGMYSEDYLALPAEKEVFGSNTWGNSSIEAQLFQFDWYKTASNRIKKTNGSNNWWWERSPRRNDTVCFCRVNSNGAADTDTAKSTYGVSFIGCI